MGYSANYSGRELVNFARIWTSEGQNTPTKKLVKEFDKKKNRQATRQAIHHKNYDKIPQNEKVKQEDVWNWDQGIILQRYYTINNDEIREDIDPVIEELKNADIESHDDYELVGVGDKVEDVLNRLGITEERFKSWFNLKECSCTERKKWLNKIFKWRKRAKYGK